MTSQFNLLLLFSLLISATSTVFSQKRQTDKELEKALKGLEMGQSPEQVLNKLAHGLMNKLIHAPTRYLRDAGADADQDALIIASNVLGIYEEKDN